MSNRVTEVRLDHSSSDGKSGLFFAEFRPTSPIGIAGTTTAPPEVRGWTAYRDPAATKSA